MSGLDSYAAYVPYWRMKRERIGSNGAGRGERTVASFDEDTTTMAVAAGLQALQASGIEQPAATVDQLLFSTTTPAYVDKTNATAIHAALGMRPDAVAFDLNGAAASGIGAVRAALASRGTTLVALADQRSGRPGSAEESQGGDAAAALVFGPGPHVLTHLASASQTLEFTDRWRLPEEATSRVWEERFGEHVYVSLALKAIEAALSAAGLTAADVDHLIVAGLHARAARAVSARAGIKPAAALDALGHGLGNVGSAQLGVALAAVLDQAGSGDTVCTVVLADGAHCDLWRTTEQLTQLHERQRRSVVEQIDAGRSELDYLTFLNWTGQLDREPPRRPDPAPPAGPPALRGVEWKYGLVAAQCTQCGTRHLPPSRVCFSCNAVDQMRPVSMAGVPARITTFSIDHLAYTPSPPFVAAVVDFEGGGRLRCEVTDCSPDEVHIGMQVEPTFRRLFTSGGLHNYFWKVRPVRSAPATEHGG